MTRVNPEFELQKLRGMVNKTNMQSTFLEIDKNEQIQAERMQKLAELDRLKHLLHKSAQFQTVTNRQFFDGKRYKAQLNSTILRQYQSQKDLGSQNLAASLKRAELVELQHQRSRSINNERMVLSQRHSLRSGIEMLRSQQECTKGLLQNEAYYWEQRSHSQYLQTQKQILVNKLAQAQQRIDSSQ